MSFNIQRWHTSVCTLTAPAAHCHSEHLASAKFGRPKKQTTVILSFDVDDSTVVGYLEKDILHIETFTLRGDGSGWAMEHVREWLNLTKGELRATLVWEDGSLSRFICVDGVVVEKDIDLNSL